MTADRLFFEIAIYRVPEEHFNKQYDVDLERYWKRHEQASGRTRDQMSASHRVQMEHHFWKTYGGPWNYNQVIGWLQIIVHGSQIRGDLWKTSAKRLQRKGRHQLSLIGKAFEVPYLPDQSSAEIQEALAHELHSFIREFRGGKHVLDLECFLNLVPFIDWRRIVGLR